MYLMNAWYCAGWSHDVHQARDSILTRKIAGERLVLYRTPAGNVVALEDRCLHRQAALSMGRKEGDSLRCMYHGLKFNPQGECTEIPGQQNISKNAKVRSFPVIEKNNWIWVWMGDAEKADERLICFSMGLETPGWHLRPSQMHYKADYRLQIENFSDLSHLAWVHENSVGGDLAYSWIKPQWTATERGVNVLVWVRSIAPTSFVSHLLPEGSKVDICFDVQQTVPCNFICRMRIFTAGTRTEGESDGQLLADTWTCQAVTPCDSESFDYYYSWGACDETEKALPGISNMLGNATDSIFDEDRVQLEAMHLRRSEKPDARMINIVHDAVASRFFRVLNALIQQERVTSPPRTDQHCADVDHAGPR